MDITGMRDTIEWYDRNATQYAEGSKAYTSLAELGQFSQLLPDGAKILDLGCGAGHDSQWFWQEGLEVTGVDLSSGLLALAQKRTPNASFIQSDIRQLPFENNMFDGVWARASLVHLETLNDTRTAINEIHRVTKPGGLVYIFVKAQAGKDKTAIVADKLSGHQRFFQYYTVDELQTLLSDSGFKIDSIDQFIETEVNPNGRPEVEWIRVYAYKLKD